MKGVYNLVIHDSKLRYELLLDRNITIVKGKSGTGKSTLFAMVRELNEYGKVTGIHCNMADKVIALGTKKWHTVLDGVKGHIIIIDEDVCDVMYYRDFVNFVQSGTNYYIFITRDSQIDKYTFSVNSIYEFVTTEVNGSYCTKLECKFHYAPGFIKPDIIVTEDSNAGKQVYELLLNCRVESSYGKSQICPKVSSLIGKYKNIYVVADGAAFGSYIERLMALAINTKESNIYVFTPESFEYLLLHARKFYPLVRDMIDNTYNYCNYEDFISWEQYYTWLLGEVCQKLYNHGYSKNRLQSEFKTTHMLETIKSQLLDIDESCFRKIGASDGKETIQNK